MFNLIMLLTAVFAAAIIGYAYGREEMKKEFMDYLERNKHERTTNRVRTNLRVVPKPAGTSQDSESK